MVTAWNRRPAGTGTGRVSRLRDEVGFAGNVPDDAVERDAVVEAARGQRHEVVHRDGRVAREQGGVELDSNIEKDPRKVLDIKDGAVLRIGKKLFFRLRKRKFFSSRLIHTNYR